MSHGTVERSGPGFGSMQIIRSNISHCTWSYRFTNDISRGHRINCIYLGGYRVGAMVFNTTFNNISVISWRSVLLVEESRIPGENCRPAASHWQTLSHNVVSSTPRDHHERD